MTGARSTRAGRSPIERFVRDLAAARIGDTFNQYRETGADDAGRRAPSIRRANLTRYLDARVNAPVVLVAEAAGWRGARYSGLCLLCERQFDRDDLLPAADQGFERSSRHPHGWSEPSATIVQSALAVGGWNASVLLWNVVPTHPAGPRPHSNRRPRSGEVEQGRAWLGRLLGIVGPRNVGAIGRVAAGALGGEAPCIRHPARGGAAACRAGIVAQLTEWLG